MLTRLQKLQRLSAGERWLLIQSLLLLPLTLCGVSALGVSRWQRLLIALAKFRITSGPHDALRDAEATAQRARAIARIIYIGAHHGIYQANCLQQTLVLCCLLRRNGIESEIRFGARKEEGQLEAHAWIECSGIPLNDDRDVCRHFAPFEGRTVARQIAI